MQQAIVEFEKLNVSYLLGDAAQLAAAAEVCVKEPFHPDVIDLLDRVSRRLLANRAARKFPDVVTFGFWIRRASTVQMRDRFLTDGVFRLGRGLVFHVAPSNVAVNFAYSLTAALLCGNANVVKAPSKDFEQVTLIVDAFRDALEASPALRPFITVVRYGHDQQVNDALSAVCAVRVIWGGNETIRRFRQSPMAPRAAEIAFADRYSVAYIDAKRYLEEPDKERVANNFYNDTYLTDQNACTSPRIVFWDGSGEDIAAAKQIFWDRLHALATEKYAFQDIWAIDKLSKLYELATAEDGVREVPPRDNLITRVQVRKPTAELMRWKCHAGFFFECDVTDVTQMRDACSDMACQTISYLGDKERLRKLLSAGIKGVDRIVPIGSTMDFDLIWDGYDLVERLTRMIDVR